MAKVRGGANAVGALAMIGMTALSAGCQGLQTRNGPIVQAPPACVDFTVSIYFESQSAKLTREAGALMAAAARRARGCAVSGIEVVGLADAPGDPQANLQLSKNRAEAVTRELARRGLKSASVKGAAAGDAGAQNPQGQAKPLRRRADVIFHVAPKRAGA